MRESIQFLEPQCNRCVWHAVQTCARKTFVSGRMKCPFGKFACTDPPEGKLKSLRSWHTLQPPMPQPTSSRRYLSRSTTNAVRYKRMKPNRGPTFNHLSPRSFLEEFTLCDDRLRPWTFSDGNVYHVERVFHASLNASDCGLRMRDLTKIEARKKDRAMRENTGCLGAPRSRFVPF